MGRDQFPHGSQLKRAKTGPQHLISRASPTLKGLFEANGEPRKLFPSVNWIRRRLYHTHKKQQQQNVLILFLISIRIFLCHNILHLMTENM